MNQKVVLKIQQDGQILVLAGKIVARLESNGDPDMSFSGDGFADVSLFRTHAMELQQDGKILIAGEFKYSDDQIIFGITRLNQDGTTDDSFSGGVVNFDMSNEFYAYDFVTDLAIQPDGKILVGGNAGTNYRNPSYSFGVARLNQDGSLNAAFGNSGKAFVYPPSPAYLTSMKLQSDGKIVLGGFAEKQRELFGSPGRNNFALSRLTAAGQLDQSFGNLGYINLPLVYGDNRLTDLTLDENNLYATGFADFVDTAGVIAKFTVLTPQSPPVITLTSPTVNNFYLAPATIRLVATASSPKDKIQKVEFYDGSTLITTEYNAPYDWYWRQVPAGLYNVTAKATDTNGASAVSDVVQVSVITPTVNEFILMNAATDKRVVAMYDGIVLDKATLPAGLNIKAITNFKKLGSVVFLLDGIKVRTENGYPYSLAGDSPSGDYHAWDLPLGTHTLTAVPYNHYSSGGTAGYSLTITFTVVNSSTNMTTFSNSRAGEENIRFGIYPNPANGMLNVSLGDFVPSTSATISILALDGSVLKNQRWNGQSRSTQVNVSSLPAGTYLVRINDGKKIIKKRFVKM